MTIPFFYRELINCSSNAVPTSEALTVFLSPHGNPTAGESYTLTCTALELIDCLKNMPSLQWLDSSGSAVNGTDITVGELQITDSAAILALTFDPVHTSHAGEYSCQAMLESPAVVGSVMESVVNTIIVSSKSLQLSLGVCNL